MSSPKIKRRDFIKTAAGSFAGVGFFGVPKIARAMGSRRHKPVNKYDTPSFSAFIDTVIPGKELDPTGAPGGLEAGTLEYLAKVQQQGLFPISIDLIHFIVTLALDLIAGITHFCSFDKLNLKDREKIIESLTAIPGTAFLLRLMRAPFYTGAINRVGFDYLGYPGPNEGFPDYSFDEAVSLPHPSSIDGNLP